jgi:hypothetical protein
MGEAKSAVKSASSAPWALLLLSLPAGVAIWSGWVGIGTLCGFGKVEPLPGLVDGLVIDTRITLPIGMETYAAVALRAWLTSTPGEVRTFAKWSALAALSVGAAGQIAYHLMVAAGITAAPWPVVAAVATLPVAVLGMGAALAHLRHTSQTPGASSVTTPADAPGSTTTPANAKPLDTLDTLDTNTFPQVSGGEFCPEPLDTNTRRVDTNKPRPRKRAANGAVNAAAELVRELTAKHPDWTQEQIAAKAGRSVRQVRRYLKDPAPAAATTAAETPSGPALVSTPEVATASQATVTTEPLATAAHAVESFEAREGSAA